MKKENDELLNYFVSLLDSQETTPVVDEGPEYNHKAFVIDGAKRARLELLQNPNPKVDDMIVVLEWYSSLLNVIEKEAA